MGRDAPTISLDRLFKPRAIAVVGASARTASFGYRVTDNLVKHGFAGPVYPVNPRYGEVAGVTCYGSLDALPGPVDLVYMAVPAARGPALLAEAGAAGAGAAVVAASGYIDGGAEGAALQHELEATAAAHGIAVCGPNNMGLINHHDRVAAWPAPYPKRAPGGVAVITQSGSVGIVLSQDDRGLGLAYLVTAGNEATLTAADYLDYFARDDRVRVVALFLEAIREPAKFAAAAAEARGRGKHIVVVKVGRSEPGRRTVAAHTGAIAGEDAVYDAFFRRHGIMRAADLDTMIEATALASACPAPPPTPHVAPVTLSGGEAALIADMGAELGVSMPALAAETVERLRPAFPPFATPRNPVDAYGLGWDTERFAGIVEALIADPDLGVVALCMDSGRAGGADVSYVRAMAEICAPLAAATEKKIVYINNTSIGGLDDVGRAAFEAAGMACLLGMREGLGALAAWIRLGAPEPTVPATDPATARAWRAGAAAARSEAERSAVIAAAGVPMAPVRAVTSAEEAVAAGDELGFPLVLKGTAPGLLHKTEHDLVRLGLADAEAVRAAYDALDRRLGELAPDGAEIVAQPLITGGVELILGARHDADFGPVVAVGPGGTLVELGGAASLRLAPVDIRTARAMLAETAAGRLLAGVRGKGPFDAEAAAAAVAAFSVLAAALGDSLAAVEINPLMVLPAGKGVVGVDAAFEFAAKKEDME